MLAISKPKRTIYACNLFQKGPNMVEIIENLFTRDSSRKHRDCKYKQSVLAMRLQAYLVQINNIIASIFGPYHKNHNNHMQFSPIFQTRYGFSTGKKGQGNLSQMIGWNFYGMTRIWNYSLSRIHGRGTFSSPKKSNLDTGIIQ